MFRIKLNLQTFSDMGDIGETAAPSVGGESLDSSAGTAPEQAASVETVDKQSSFAKRLAEERAKLEREYGEKYKDYDDLREVSEFFREETKHGDLGSLKEAITKDRLARQAEQQGVPIEVMERMQKLEADQQRLSELEKTFQEQHRHNSFKQSIEQYGATKEGLDTGTLWNFMAENGLPYNEQDPSRSFDLAYKAMMHDELQKQIEASRKEAQKEVITAKSKIAKNLPTAGNKTATIEAAKPKTLKDAQRAAMARLNNL